MMYFRKGTEKGGKTGLMSGNWGMMVVVGFYDIVADNYLQSSSESRLIKSDRVIYASNPVCLKAKERNFVFLALFM